MKTQEQNNMAPETTDFEGLQIRKPDSQGRISIGKEHQDQSYAVEPLENGDIVLRPIVVMHKREAWLFANQEALASVKRGIEQSEKGQVSSLGTFARFAEEPTVAEE